jgi:hypothetical protein
MYIIVGVLIYKNERGDFVSKRGSSISLSTLDLLYH